MPVNQRTTLPKRRRAEQGRARLQPPTRPRGDEPCLRTSLIVQEARAEAALARPEPHLMHLVQRHRSAETGSIRQPEENGARPGRYEHRAVHDVYLEHRRVRSQEQLLRRPPMAAQGRRFSGDAPQPDTASCVAGD